MFSNGIKFGLDNVLIEAWGNHVVLFITNNGAGYLKKQYYVI